MKKLAAAVICTGVTLGFAVSGGYGAGGAAAVQTDTAIYAAERNDRESAVQDSGAVIVRQQNRDSVESGMRNSTVDAEMLSLETTGERAELAFTAKEMCAILCYPSEEQK